MLPEKDKEDILNQFLQVASNYLRNNFSNYSTQRFILRSYFKNILGKRNSVNHHLYTNQQYNGQIGNIYDCIGLTTTKHVFMNHADKYLLSKCIKNIINNCHVSNSNFIKMQQVSKSNRTFTKWSNSIIKQNQYKHNYYLGNPWIIDILLITFFLILFSVLTLL